MNAVNEKIVVYKVFCQQQVKRKTFYSHIEDAQMLWTKSNL